MEERLEHALWVLSLIWLGALLIFSCIGFYAGYKYRGNTGLDMCRLEGVTCFDYKDSKLVRMDDFEQGVACYTLDGKNVSCIQR